MEITTKEPKRPKTQVIITMTDEEAVEIREDLYELDLLNNYKLTPATKALVENLMELTELW